MPLPDGKLSFSRLSPGKGHIFSSLLFFHLRLKYQRSQVRKYQCGTGTRGHNFPDSLLSSGIQNYLYNLDDQRRRKSKQQNHSQLYFGQRHRLK